MYLRQHLVVGLVFLFQASKVLAAPVHHDLDVVVTPDTTAIEVRDTISLPKGYPASLTFSLHPELRPKLQDKTAKLIELPLPAVSRLSPLNQSTGIVPRRYRVELASGTTRFTLHYSGSIAHSLQSKGEEYARSFQETQGIISPQGVFLSGASVWYPHIDDQLITFDLRIRLPET